MYSKLLYVMSDEPRDPGAPRGGRSAPRDARESTRADSPDVARPAAVEVEALRTPAPLARRGRPARQGAPLAPTRSEIKERMTFRMAPDLASALRRLPNQTAFVERAVREALGQVCPLCQGTGEAPYGHLAVSNLKRSPIGRLDRPAAAQLRALVRLGRQLPATDLVLQVSEVEARPELDFRLMRDRQVLLSGRICRGMSHVVLPQDAAAS